MRIAIAVVSLIVGVLPVQAGGLVKLESKSSVKETTDRLAAAVEQRGIRIVARVDHAAGAKAAGLELAPSELLMFGNPKLGTPLMQANPEIGIDLPIKVLTWQDKDGKVWIGYAAPDEIVSRHGVSGRDEIVKAMRGALDGLVKAASGQP